ncbi:MAG: restriction endonuclease subunit S [Cyanobium sp.]
MSFPRYPAYKPSGVEWLGDVPEHWRMGQSRRRFRHRNEPARDEDEQLTASQKHGIIKQSEFIESEGRRVVEVIKGQDILKHVEPGDFVISMRSFQGGLEYSKVRGSISSAYVMLAPVKQVIPEFFSWLFKSSPYIQALQSTTNLVRDGQALRFSNFCQVEIPIIPANEQLEIATFLDRETAKIDALIAEQQRLIELLQEKRQGVISHAVTKGLNPDAPMKDSGVEWLGEVPERWEVIEARREIAFLTSGSRGWADYYSDSGSLFIRIGNLTRDSIDLDLSDIQRVDPPDGSEGERTLVSPGDILFSITAYLGSVAVVPKGGERACVSQHVCLVRLKEKRLLPKWLGYFVLSTAGKSFLEATSYGGTKVQLSLDDIKSFPLAVPTAREQAEIIDYVEGAIQHLKGLVSEAKNSISLLQERRSALISAAVTGQIDVRGLVPEAEAA